MSVLILGTLSAFFVRRHFSAPVPAAAKQLWIDRDSWTGRSVEVAGVLKAFGAGTVDEHYAIEDDGFRVGVRGEARPEPRTLLGRRVRARGVFVFTEKTGGYLESPSLAVDAAN